jgi:hypothetical protein
MENGNASNFYLKVTGVTGGAGDASIRNGQRGT